MRNYAWLLIDESAYIGWAQPHIRVGISGALNMVLEEASKALIMMCEGIRRALIITLDVIAIISVGISRALNMLHKKFAIIGMEMARALNMIFENSAIKRGKLNFTKENFNPRAFPKESNFKFQISDFRFQFTNFAKSFETTCAKTFARNKVFSHKTFFQKIENLKTNYKVCAKTF